MKKNFLLVVSCILLISYSLIGQTFQGTSIIASKFQVGSSSSYNLGNMGHNIGKKVDSQTQDSETARSIYLFDLSDIPTDAKIVSVELECFAWNFPNSNTTYKYKIVQASSGSTYKKTYDNVASGSVLFKDLKYILTNLKSSTTLTNLVKNNKGGEISLGAMSQSEAASASEADLGLTLIVDFKEKIEVTAKNNFVSENGDGGVMIIDGQIQTLPQSGNLIATKYEDDN
ncbi:MAG: hypothetical protein JEY94_19270 [Melioribacteraceae bacterium]|nr:hypothetical protein [Melioribacteraceae bacterium]